MRRIGNFVIILCLMAAILGVHTLQARAVAHTDHCACGNSAAGVADHSCERVQWQPLSSVISLTAVDFGKIPSGNYYLDGPAQVTNWSSLGKLSSDTLKTEPEATVQLRICLNGQPLTAVDRVFGAIYMQSRLSICDCSGKQSEDGSWRWEGSMIGGGNRLGGIIYCHAGSQVDVYGGNIIGGAVEAGGAFVVASDSCGDLNGDKVCDDKDKKLANSSVMNLYNGHITGGSVSGDGGSIYLIHSAKLNIYGGTVTGGYAKGNGGNIFGQSSTTLNILGGEISCGISEKKGGNIYKATNLTLENALIAKGTAAEGGNIYTTAAVDYTASRIYGGKPEAVRVVTVNEGKATESCDYTLQKALIRLEENSYLKLTGDLQEEVLVSGDVYLDMNGYDLSGITLTGKLYGFDSATDGYEGDFAGRLTCKLDGGQVMAESKPPVGAIRRYLTVQEGNVWSFHRFYLGITHVLLRPDEAGMGYKATFAGDEAVKAQLSGNQAYGYQLWIEGYDKVNRGYPAEKFGGIQTLTLGLTDILKQTNDTTENAKNAETGIHAVVYMRLTDGRSLFSQEMTYDLKQLIHAVDDKYPAFNQTQQAALQRLGGRYSDIMVTWDVENFHHATGGIWKRLNQKEMTEARRKALWKVNEETTFSSYYLPQGNYVLTEDWDLGSEGLNILPKTCVRICLNGYKITASSRAFRVGGQLQLCDCHSAGQEGDITSTYANLAPVFYIYWGGQIDLYGGDLYALNDQSSAGVGAVSHDGGSLNADKMPGVFNMYGGSISGQGIAAETGGLVCLWNGAVFNMYGGEMYGGKAQNGGAVGIWKDCAFNMYGGTLRGNSAEEKGGAVYLMNASAVFNMYGGTITGNEAQQGGGVYSEKASVCLGGAITGNSSGVYDYEGNVELTGLVKLTDNTQYNLKLDASHVQVQDMDTGSKVGVAAKVRGYWGEDSALAQCFVLENMEDLILRDYMGKLMLLPKDLQSFKAVDAFSVGYGTVCTNPENPVGLPLAGFGNTSERLSRQVIDDLYVSAVAMTDADNNTVLLYTCDIQRIPDTMSSSIRRHISSATGVPYENIFISSTHTHSAPDLLNTMQVIRDYSVQMQDAMVQAALEAMVDRKPAAVQYGAMDVERMNFVRHYYYFVPVDAGTGDYVKNSDGAYIPSEQGDYTKQYCGDNFGVYPDDKSPGNLFHATTGDHSLQVIRFVRDGRDVVLANWAAHPHFTGSDEKYDISSDYVGAMRQAVQTNEDCYFAFIQGSAGNMNEFSNVSGEHQFSNAINPDNTARTRYGEKMAEYVSQVLETMTDAPAGSIQTDSVLSTVPINHQEDHKLEAAERLREVYYIWRFETFKEENGRLPNARETWEFCMEYGFQSIFHANAVVTKAGLADTAEIEAGVFSIGNSLGFYCAPGELWSDTALEIKGASAFPMTFTVGYTNQNLTYFPDGDAATEYESYEKQLSSLLFPDAIQTLKAYWHEALQRLYNNA